MQRRARPALLTLLAALLLPGIGAAQSATQATAHNTVTVRIPTILRLDVTANAGDASQAVHFHIDGTTVTPDSLTVKVLANTRWHLSVQDVSASEGDDGPPIAYSVQAPNGWTSFTTPTPGIDETVAAGNGPTNGWHDVPMRFRLASPATAPSGSSTRTLLFTLTRP